MGSTGLKLKLLDWQGSKPVLVVGAEKCDSYSSHMLGLANDHGLFRDPFVGV